MKRILQVTSIFCMFIFLVGCDHTFTRAERTVTLLQENITKVVNELTEIQLLESYVQKDFESTLSDSEDLSAFLSEDSAILQNVSNRSKHLDKLEELITSLEELNKEMDSQKDTKDESLNNQIVAIQELLTPLIQDLNTYVTDYKANIEPEKQTYQSIANPKTDYNSFSKVFSNVSTLNNTNQINLDSVLKYFETLNAKIIDLKVYLTNITQK